MKEFEWFERFEWFEWFGPSPIEPFDEGPLVKPDGSAAGRGGKDGGEKNKDLDLRISVDRRGSEADSVRQEEVASAADLF